MSRPHTHCACVQRLILNTVDALAKAEAQCATANSVAKSQLALADDLSRQVAALREALREISTLVVDSDAAPSFTFSNLCEATSRARAALEEGE